MKDSAYIRKLIFIPFNHTLNTFQSTVHLGTTNGRIGIGIKFEVRLVLGLMYFSVALTVRQECWSDSPARFVFQVPVVDTASRLHDVDHLL